MQLKDIHLFSLLLSQYQGDQQTKQWRSLSGQLHFSGTSSSHLSFVQFTIKPHHVRNTSSGLIWLFWYLFSSGALEQQQWMRDEGISAESAMLVMDLCRTFSEIIRVVIIFPSTPSRPPLCLFNRRGERVMPKKVFPTSGDRNESLCCPNTQSAVSPFLVCLTAWASIVMDGCCLSSVAWYIWDGAWGVGQQIIIC